MTERMKYLPNHLINKDEWDYCIQSSSNRRIYAMSFFLDIFSPRWQAMILDDGNAVMPVTWSRKFGVSYVFQPIFVQQLGFFILNESYSGALPLFIDKLSLSFRFIDISLNEMNDINHENYQAVKMNNYLLRLNKSYDSLRQDYNKNTRRNIIKAERLGVVLLPHYTPAEIVKLFILNNGRGYRNIRKENYRRLVCLIERGLSEGFVQVKAARARNGDIIAAACFLEDFDRYIFYFSANTEEGRRQGAMFLLIDSFIKQYSGAGKLVDFNGSMNPNMARFYKGFGAEASFYQRLKINRLGFPLNYLK